MRWVAVKGSLGSVGIELVRGGIGHLLQACVARPGVALIEQVPHPRGEPSQFVGGIAIRSRCRHGHTNHVVGHH